jgi:quercetin dioxygenase-like cupin family protein
MTQNIAGEPDTTSGSATRDSRTLREPVMRFNLLEEIGRLAGEPQWKDGDRNSIVLAKDARFRMLLTVLRSGARMGDEDADATLSVHLITGSATASRGSDSVMLGPGEIAVLEAGSSWALEADQESAALLTFSWPEELARV